MLAALGQTFSTGRDLKPTGKARDLIAPDVSARTDAAARGAGSALAAGPVKLEVVYDGVAAALEPDGDTGQGRLGVRLAPGKPSQRVTFRLENTGEKRLAVLLCLDGKNTIAINNESLTAPDKPPARFRMYVLEPHVRYEITGMLMDEQGTRRPFEVAAEDATSLAYGAMAEGTRGKIQMIVYGEPLLELPPPPITGSPEPTALGNGDTEEKKDVAFAAAPLETRPRGLSRAGTLAAAKPAALKQTGLVLAGGKLGVDADVAKSRSRGLIIPSPRTLPGGKVEIVNFVYDEQPLDSLQITYYTR
jgi:hypothetical protein